MEATAINIIKANGSHALFLDDKVRQGVLRAGATKAESDMVLRKVRAEVRSGMSTRAIYALVVAALRAVNKSAACRYTLRDALLRLGPAGFHFEKYLASLLAANGYETELPEELQGACVRHEIDVLARKSGKAFAIECKFRNDFSDHVQLKDVMAAYARHLDLLDGAALGLCPRFNDFWIATNGVFSDRARQYGMCKGLRLLGWKYPAGGGLAPMIDSTGLYPVTVLDGLTTAEFAAFSHAGLLLCRDMVNHEPSELAHRTGLSRSRIEELIETAGEVLAYKEKVTA